MSDFLHYYVDIRPHHKHEVHHDTCTNMPPMEFRQYLGMFDAPIKAVAMAKVVYDEASECKHCSTAHTKRGVRLR